MRGKCDCCGRSGRLEAVDFPNYHVGPDNGYTALLCTDNPESCFGKYRKGLITA